MTNGGYVRALDARDGPLRARMMRTAFSTSRDSRLLDMAAFEWSDRDESGLVLGAFLDGELLATMRGEVCHSSWELDSLTHCKFQARMFPGLLLSAGATAAGLQNTGLNSLLRLYFLDYAERVGALALYGTVWGGGSRTRLLQTLKYELRDTAVDVSYAESHLPTQTATLDLQRHAATARAMLVEMTKSMQLQFPMRSVESTSGGD